MPPIHLPAFPSLQSVPYPSATDAATLTASPLLNLIKDGTVDLVINAAPAGKTSQPGKLRAPPEDCSTGLLN